MSSPIHWTVRGGREVLRFSTRAARKLRPRAAHIPPWERSVLDDVAAMRPWNIRVKIARQVALRRLASLREGVTVVIVNWNTREVTADVVRRVQEFSGSATSVIVVDNGSTDGSRELFRAWPGVQTVLLRSNAGHGVALDLGVCSSRTRITVTLDSDAIPLTQNWLDPAVRPIHDQGAVLAGLRSSRGFVHPVYSAVRTADFVRRRLSFQPFIPPGVDSSTAKYGENAWDTSELLTPRLLPAEVSYVEATENPVSGLPGMTVADVVYHHGGVSRDTGGSVDETALGAWRDACARIRAAIAAG